MIGRTLGHYRILDRLGAGGMGVVWLAEDQTLKRRVALKTLRQDLARSHEKLARFEREAKAVAALNHPNIVTIHSIEQVDDVRFLAMEYVPGRTLDELIPAGGLALPVFLKIAVPVADALAAAHAAGITHRDLKPGNIVVGDDGRVKVLDFGLAKLQATESTQIYGHEVQSTLTQEGTVVGTLHYMSPEQLQMKHVDHRSDLFSLGVVLYEMATGDLPFRGDSAAQVISSVMRDSPRRLEDVNERLPPELGDLVARCLEKDAGRRIASAAEVRDRLTATARALDSGVLGATGSRWRRLAARVRRRARPATLAGAAVLTIAVAALPFAFRALRSGDGGGVVAVPEERPPAIAVLPLADFSGDPEYFVDGMTDGLIGSLARLGGVRVISRQSAMHYKGSSKRLPEIAAELGVDYVVEGSIAREGSRLRLQAQVVRPDPEQQVWAEVFVREATDVLSLHNDVATAIARAVQVRLSPTEEVRMAAAKSVDPAVYEAYLQGRYWGGKSGLEDLRKARGYFERAVALDPGFAPAWAGLADALIGTELFHSESEPNLAEAEAAANRALQLDEALPEAWAALADISQARWDWPSAEQQARKAIDLDPNSAPGHQRYWVILAPQLRLEEARLAIEAAHRLDPLSAHIAAHLGLQCVLDRRFDEAERVLKQALELDPDYKHTHLSLWLVYQRQGKDPERGLELASYLDAMGFAQVLPEFRERLGASGYSAALRWVANRLSEEQKGKASAVGVVAGLLAEAGETDRALEWLKFGLENRAWEMSWLAVAPDYERLHGHPEFERLLVQLGLPRPSA